MEFPGLNHGYATAYTCYLDFGACLAQRLPVDAAARNIAGAAFSYLRRLPIRLTTIYPDNERPGEYVTVRILPTPFIGWRRNATGTSPQWAVRNPSLYLPNVVYIGWGDYPMMAAVTAHEFVHCVSPDGVSHEDTPGNLMRGDANIVGGRLSSERFAQCLDTIAKLRRGERLIPFVRPDGVWTVDWTKLI